MNADSSQMGLPAVDDHALVRDGIAGLVGVRRTWLYLGSLTTRFWSAVDVRESDSHASLSCPLLLDKRDQFCHNQARSDHSYATIVQ